ncbi:RlpA-like double-psi beta-barrel domain-containing protein [Lentzea sp. NPDC005914]
MTAKVTDRCVGCASGDIDLSPAAFRKIGRLDEGRVKVSWDFI